MQFSFIQRPIPLEPELALGEGSVATSLLKRTLVLAEDKEFKVSAARGFFLVIGQELPWVDGVQYFGRSGDVFLPTTRALEYEELFTQKIFLSHGPVVVHGSKLLTTSNAALIKTADDSALRRIIEGPDV